MLCPKCNVGVLGDDFYCRRCGADLSEPSKSLVTTQSHLPALNTPQLPRLAAGVGALAVGFGLEMLRRGLIAKLSQPGSEIVPAVPGVEDLRNIFMPQENKPARKLPKGYEVQETVVYMRRVMRRD